MNEKRSLTPSRPTAGVNPAYNVLNKLALCERSLDGSIISEDHRRALPCSRSTPMDRRGQCAGGHFSAEEGALQWVSVAG